LLFGEALGNLLLLDADGSFKGCISSEGPAGTTATLMLDWGHVRGMVNCGGLSDTEHTRHGGLKESLLFILILRYVNYVFI